MILSDVYTENPSPIFLYKSISATIPPKQLLPHSFQVESTPPKQFQSWLEYNHSDSYHIMQRIAKVWEVSGLTDQYLIYGKIDSSFFNWDMVPYKKCSTCIGRAFQQILVLWRTVFGGIAVSNEIRNNQSLKYKTWSNSFSKMMLPKDISCKGNDAFCKEEVIKRQWVITGEKVNVLFNYAPIGFGGERLHFLVVPKEHREKFTDVTEEEYCETMMLTQKLVDHFTETRKTVKNVYLLNKTGVDAGQTVKHWHLHVIFSTTRAQDFWGKITVFKNIFFGSSPMKIEELTKKVDSLREELILLSTDLLHN